MATSWIHFQMGGPSTVISKSLLCKGRNPQSQRVITGVYMHHVINEQVIQPWTINLDPLCFMKMMYSRFIADYQLFSIQVEKWVRHHDLML